MTYLKSLFILCYLELRLAFQCVLNWRLKRKKARLLAFIASASAVKPRNDFLYAVQVENEADDYPDSRERAVRGEQAGEGEVQQNQRNRYKDLAHGVHQ